MKNLTIILIISIMFLSGCTTIDIKKGDIEAHYMSTKDIKDLKFKYNPETKEFSLEVGEANASAGKKVLFDSAFKAIKPL